MGSEMCIRDRFISILYDEGVAVLYGVVHLYIFHSETFKSATYMIVIVLQSNSFVYFSILKLAFAILKQA